MANVPDFSVHTDPAILQAFQNAQAQKQKAEEQQRQGKQQKFQQTLDTINAVSGAVHSMAQMAEKSKQDNLIKSASAILSQPTPPSTITPEGPTMQGQSDTMAPVVNPDFVKHQQAKAAIGAVLAPKQAGETIVKQMSDTQPKVANQAKLFVNDQGQAMNIQPDANGIFNAPEGFKEKSMAVADKWTAPRKEANAIKQEQFDETQWNKLGKAVNSLDKGSRTAVGMAATGNQRAARALALLDNPNMDTVLKKYVEADLAGIMQGGAPHEQMLRQQGYDNLVTTYANLKQKLTSEPQAIKVPEIRQQLKDTIQGIIAVDNDVLDTNVGIAKESYLKAIKNDPKRFERLVGAANKVKTTGSNVPQQTANTNRPSLDSFFK